MKTMLPAFFLCLLATAANAVEFPAPTVPNGIGVCVHPTAATALDFDQLQAAGIGFIRADFNWQDIQPQGSSGYDFSFMDNFVAQAAARNIRIYGLLCYGNTNYGDPTDPAYYGTSSFRNGFENYAKATVSHYVNQFPGEVMSWELWNEPNWGFWPGATNDPVTGATQYMALANQVIPKIRAADPNATIIAPATANVANTQTYLTACFNQGLLNLVDGVSIHPYKPESPEAAVGDYAWVNGMMTSAHNGPSRPIISGEWGYTVGVRDLGYTDSNGNPVAMTPQRQGDYVQRMMLTNLSQGVPLSVWYDWRNGADDPTNTEANYGLVDHYGVPKPGFYAMKTLTSSLRGQTFQWTMSDGNENHWLEIFRNTTTGVESLVAWTADDTPAISSSPLYGTFLLNSTPMYLGLAWARGTGSGKWSDPTWGGGNNGWVNGAQAVFNTAQTISVDGKPTVSGLQFNNVNVTLNGGALRFTSGGGNLYTGSGAVTINSNIAGGDPFTFQLRKSGSGTLTLGAANTFTGGVLIGQGAIQLGNANALRNNKVTVNTYNGLKFSTGINTFTLGGLAGSGSGRIALADVGNTAVTLQVGYNNLDSEYSGRLSGTGGKLKKIGSGLLTLSGTNTYTGGTTISAGSLRFNSGASSPSGSNSANSVTIESAGTLLADGAYASAESWLGSAKINTTSTGTLALTADSSEAITMGNYTALSIGASGDYTYSGAMTPATDNKYRFGGGGGTLTVSSALGDGSSARSLAVNGNVILSGANSYSGGTTVNRGNLQFAAGSCPAGAGSITIKSGGALVANGAYTDAQNWINSGKIDAANSDGALAIAADTWGINMTGYNNLFIGSTGDHTLGGTITPANNTYKFGGGGGNLLVWSDLSGGRNLVTAGNVTFANAKSYMGTTTVNSGGKLTLSSAGSINSTSGITLQAGGTLIQNSRTALSRPITFNGGTFGGAGSYTGDLTVGNGHLSPGDGGIGALSVTGNLSLSSSSALDYDFGVIAGSCDLVSLSGNLILDGTIDITSSALASGSYTIFSGATSIVDRGLTFGTVSSDYDWSYSIVNDGGRYSVIVSAVPEPSPLLMLAVAGLSMFGWRRKVMRTN